MRIHKEGYLPIVVTLFIVGLLVGFYTGHALHHGTHVWLTVLVCVVAFLLIFQVVRFFRVPKRRINVVPDGVLSPADGRIVAIDEVTENEYFHDKRIKISVFMSIYNVHVNSYPIDGVVEYVGYHPGKYLVAKLPKSSVDNEHNSVVVKQNDERIVLFRQIAGIVARRIVSYAKVGEPVKQGEEMGIIRFGSRVDVFLPLDAQIYVKMGDRVSSQKTVLATF
jgi:phosphatidylserine decarboxylase